ncbi:MAG: helicase HerA domain-containing protein, partial [Rhabdochlamydiaceae bacterium]
AKQFIANLFDKQMFDQLCSLDELSCENFGLKRIEEGRQAQIAPAKGICGLHGNYAAISPFVLDEIRDLIHMRKLERLEEYESRVESALMNFRNEHPNECNLEFIQLRGEQALWRLNFGSNPPIFVYLAPWTTEQDLNIVLSKMEGAGSSSFAAIITNQSAQTRVSLKDKLGICGELSLIVPTSQKTVKSDALSTTAVTHPHSAEVIESISRSLNLSIPPTELFKKANSKKQGEAVSTAQQQQHQDEEEEQVGDSSRIKLNLGNQQTGQVFWMPSNEATPNFVIFGSSQTGKTQIVKSILLELRKSKKILFTVLDFTGEYVSKESQFGTAINLGELSLNPFELDPSSSPREQKYRVAENIESVYDLEEWQVAYLIEGIRKAYEMKGIVEDRPDTWRKEPPTFKDLLNALQLAAQDGKGYERNSIRGILEKLGPVFEHRTFSQSETSAKLEQILNTETVVDIAGFDSPELKALVSEFIIEKMRHLPNSQDTLSFVVMDGPRRLFGTHSSSIQLLRESTQRRFGIILSCRDPAELPESVFNNAGVVMSFRMNDSKHAKILGEHLGIHDSQQALNKGLAGKFSALAKFSSQHSDLQFEA